MSDGAMAPSEDAPLLKAIAKLPQNTPLAVAVSGGGDSMALLHLLADRPNLSAVTVDHGLRAAARGEAAMVARFCTDKMIPHTILNWQRPDTPGNLMDQARRARYRLMAAWATGQGIGHIALGHTADDQAETFVMRLARSAGVDGLSAMAPWFDWNGTTFHRPLLMQDRAALRAYLRRHTTPWADDPSNDDPAYERVRVRQAMGQLARLGLGVETLGAVARHMTSARDALRQITAGVAQDIAEQDRGDLTFVRKAFLAQPSEIQRRLMRDALRWISGAEYSERSSGIDRLLLAAQAGRQATLAGCLMGVGPKKLRLTRELAAVQGQTCDTTVLWDGRWRLIGPHDDGLHIAALGPLGLPRCPDWRGCGLPRNSLLASPAIWRDDTLIAAPLAGFGGKWRAILKKPRDDFAAMLLSH